MQREFSLVKAMFSDSTLSASWFFPLLYVIGYVITSTRFVENPFNKIFFTVCIAIIGIGVFIWRVWLFMDVFRNGKIVDGKIIDIFHYKSTTTIGYDYVYQSKKYKNKDSIIRYQLSKYPYKRGDLIQIILNPQKPDRAFILQYYTADE